MNRADLDRYHSDDAWRAAYLAALAKAEEAFPQAGNFDAIDFAIETAYQMTDARADARAQRAADLEATRQRLAALDAAPADPAPAQPNPAQTAAARAVAAINARRVSATPQTGASAQAPTQGAADGIGEDTGQEGAKPWASAVAAINRGR